MSSTRDKGSAKMDSSVANSSGESSCKPDIYQYITITGDERYMEEPKNYFKSFHPMCLENTAHKDAHKCHQNNRDSIISLLNLKCVMILTSPLSMKFIVTSSDQDCHSAVSQVYQACNSGNCPWQHCIAVNFDPDMDVKRKAVMIESTKIQMIGTVNRKLKKGDVRLSSCAGEVMWRIAENNGNLSLFSESMHHGKVGSYI